jgi:hypothetical protein
MFCTPIGVHHFFNSFLCNLRSYDTLCTFLLWLCNVTYVTIAADREVFHMTRVRASLLGLMCLVSFFALCTWALWENNTQISAAGDPNRTQASGTDPSLLPIGGTATPTQCIGNSGGPWSQVALLPDARRGTTGASDGTYYYLVGGYQASSAMRRYDPIANSWSTMAPMPIALDTPFAMYYGDKILIFGGSSGVGETNTTYVYDIASNSWSLGAPMPQGRSALRGGVYNGKAYIVGGHYINDPTSQTWEYDIAANTWLTKTSLPVAEYASASTVIGQYLYLFGGSQDPSTPFATEVLRYDIVNDTWSTLANFPYGVTGAGASVVGNKIWVYGGFGLNGEVNTTRIYDPATNTYATGPNLNSPRAYFGYGNLGARSIAAGGNSNNTIWREVEISDITYGTCPTDTPVPPSNTPTITRTPTQTNTPTATLTATPGCNSRWGEYPIGAIGQNQGAPSALGLVSANNIWMASSYYNPATDAEETWTMQWNGTRWTRVLSPNKTSYNRLTAISVLSANDIWAVGSAFDTSRSTLTMHWDGTRWTIIPSPGSAYLTGVEAIAPDDVWAVGYTDINTTTSTTFTMHWDGTQWSVVPSPNPNYTPQFSINRLHAVAARSSNEVYATGGGMAIDGQNAFALSWDGSQWSVISIPSSIQTGAAYDVAIAPGGDIWVVGIVSDGSRTEPLILRNWTRVLDYPSENQSVQLTALWPVSDNDIWAMGTQASYHGLSWHWDGTRWNNVPVPITDQTLLTGIVAGGNELWAVGAKNYTTQMLVLHYPDPTCASPTPTATPVNCPIEFQDAPSGSTFYPYIHCLACQQIISGYPCGNPEPCIPPNNYPYFRPSNQVTRGQISKFIASAAGFNEPVSGQTFQDVAPGSTFYIFVERLASRAVMAGYSCGGAHEPCIPPDNRPYFRPNATATRGQIAKITSNAAGFYDPLYIQIYEDVPTSNPFAVYISRLTNRGVMSGYRCGNPEPCVPPYDRPYFRPANNVTRGQTSKIVSATFLPGCNPPEPPQAGQK